MSNPERSTLTSYIPELDQSHKITTEQSIELPFWIPIRSGEYTFPTRQRIKIRNDLWLVSVANLVDGTSGTPFQFVVDETKVSDDEYLKVVTEGNAHYYHKTKMKTTVISNVVHLPPVGMITEEPGSEEWKKQILEVLHGAGQYMHNTLRLINQFIDYYCSIISVNNQANEVRRVSSYETMVRLIVNVEKDGVHYSYPSTFAPDLRMANLTHPLYRVRDDTILAKFREELETLDEPSFHQLQWVKTLNHQREQRYQEALLSASQTLEALVYSYMDAKGIKELSKKGMAGFVMELSEPMSHFFSEFTEDAKLARYRSEGVCSKVANLWRLRNDVVHNQRIISRQDHYFISRGLKNLANLRRFLLHTINPKLVELENQFKKFLEPVLFSQELSMYPGQVVSLEHEWRREIDDYQIV